MGRVAVVCPALEFTFVLKSDLLDFFKSLTGRWSLARVYAQHLVKQLVDSIAVFALDNRLRKLGKSSTYLYKLFVAAVAL